MEQGEMDPKGLKKLDEGTFRGVTLQELDKHINDHGQDILSTYLGWLHEQLNDWDLSDTAFVRRQIDSWCASLGLHGLDNQNIFNAFGIWKTNETRKDPGSARRFLVAEQEVDCTLFPRQSTEQASSEVEQGRADVITARDNKIIDVLSGVEDSDVESLGLKSPDNTHKTAKPVDDINTTTRPHRIADNRGDQLMHGAADSDINQHSKKEKGIRAKYEAGIPRHRGPLHKNYVCNRCRKKGMFEYQSHLLLPESNQAKLSTGHHLLSCPTNLDPSYDRPPNRGYKCYCCGVNGKHLTTLCPENQAPHSLTQQRISAGIDTGKSATSIEWDDDYPAYSGSRKREREPYGAVNATYIHEDRRALPECSDHDQRHSKPDNKTGSYRSSQYSPPPAKRSRRSKSEKQLDRQNEGSHRWHQDPRKYRGRSPSSRSNRNGSTELFVHYSSEMDGRLSYWDGDYGDVDMPDSPTSSSKPPRASNFWHPDTPEAAIERLLPDVDVLWVSEMAGFNIDNFFAELDVYMGNRAAFSKTKSLQAHRADAEIMTEVDADGHPGTQSSDLVVRMKVDKSERQGTSTASSTRIPSTDLESKVNFGKDGH